MSEILRPRSEIVGATEEESKREAKDDVEDFLDKEAEILSAYGMKGDITLERGNQGWAFDFENRKLIYDPSFFAERGYNLRETLFGTTHELLAHYGELLRDPELVLKEVKRYSQKKHLHLLYNIFEDVLGNRRIVAELPFLEETRGTLYREKLFSKTDYSDLADHVQFVYGFIREAMVPEETVMINEKARTALDKLRVFGKDKLDILDLITTPTIEPKERFQIMRKIIEPVYLELYKEDLEKEKERQAQLPKFRQVAGSKEKQKEGKGFGEGGEGGIGEKELRKSAEEALKKQYKQYQESHPEPLSEEDEENIKKSLEQSAAERGGARSMDKNILEQWAREHGVKPESVIGYRREYKEIASLVKELSEVFKKIVSRRLKERWRHAPQLRKEGEELEESVLAEAYVESKAGGEPRVFRELTREKREQEGYGKLEMTLINDLSGSMSEGEKLAMDRRSKLLFLESLSDFSKEIKQAELESGVSLGLEVRTETRAFGDFGDVELKKMGPELLEKERIQIWEKLHQAGGGTPDYLSLEQVSESILPEREKELKEKILRKVVVVLSDGGSQDAERVKKTVKDLRRKGVIVLGLGMTESGAAVMDVYAPDASVIEDIRKLPKEVQKIIVKYTNDL